MRHRVKLMYKLLFVFFMFVSSPLYSNEFTFHCDNHDDNFSIIFDVNPIQKKVVFSHSINKEKNIVHKINKVMEIYLWDEENDSVWFLIYENDRNLPTLNVYLLNFKSQKLKVQSITNIIPADDDYNEDFFNDSFHCYILE